MPVVPGPAWPKIPVVHEDDQTDIPMVTSDYRFSGYKLLRDSQGNIIRIMPSATSQPALWSQRALRYAGWNLQSP